MSFVFSKKTCFSAPQAIFSAFLAHWSEICFDSAQIVMISRRNKCSKNFQTTFKKNQKILKPHYKLTKDQKILKSCQMAKFQLGTIYLDPWSCAHSWTPRLKVTKSSSYPENYIDFHTQTEISADLSLQSRKLDRRTVTTFYK